MIILPAIDLYDKKVVRLLHGDYKKMTVYSENPLEIAREFESSGAKYIHLVDLEGAKFGTTPNIAVIEEISKNTSLSIEIGGGIRSMDTIERYLSIGVEKVILGTVAVDNEEFLDKALEKYGEHIAVGADVKDGFIAVKGWTEKSNVNLEDFMKKMQSKGVKNVICTDISKDGAMNGTNLELYSELSKKYSLDITASGGVSSIEDIKRLKEMNVYAAIIGKAYYTGAVDLREALEVAR